VIRLQYGTNAIPTAKPWYNYNMFNNSSHTMKDLLRVNPVIKKEVGTPPSLLPTIMHSRRGPGRNEMDEVCRVLQCIVT